MIIMQEAGAIYSNRISGLIIAVVVLDYYAYFLLFNFRILMSYRLVMFVVLNWYVDVLAVIDFV